MTFRQHINALLLCLFIVGKSSLAAQLVHYMPDTENINNSIAKAQVEISVHASQVQLQWQGAAGEIYAVSRSTDLQSWTTVAELLGNNTLQGYSEPMVTSSVFFKIDYLDPTADLDGDRLSHLQELELGLNPYSIDSDGDKFSDDAELEMSSDPTNAADTPALFYATQASRVATTSYHTNHESPKAITSAYTSASSIKAASASYVGQRSVTATTSFYVSSGVYAAADNANTTYTVTFDLGAYGSLESGELMQTIIEGKNAVEPVFSVAEGWEFTGWDRVYDNVTSDLTVTAAYQQQTVTIGTGSTSSFAPLSSTYSSTRTQVIYHASEIGRAGQINSIALDVTSIVNATSIPMYQWTVRIKHLTAQNFNYSSSWANSGWTTVIDGELLVNINPYRWNTFIFSIPFEYNGTDNILIDFSFNRPFSLNDNINVKATTTGSSFRTMYGSSYEDGDPHLWSGSSPFAQFIAEIPNIRFEFAACNSCN